MTTIVDHYADCIVDKTSILESISSILVVEGYFAKKKFLDKIEQRSNLEVICKLIGDANLRYLAPEVKTGKKEGQESMQVK